MLVSQTEAATDRRPAIVICAYDRDEHGWDPVEDLSGNLWSPQGARTIAVEAADPEALAATLASQVRDLGARAILLVGRTRRANDFRVQMRAENRKPDGARLDHTGPGVARSTAPVAEMVQALKDAGLIAAASSEAEDDAGSYLLYLVLTGLPDGPDSPAIGLLRAPAGATDVAVQKGVKAAAMAMTRHLGALPRPRAS